MSVLVARHRRRLFVVVIIILVVAIISAFAFIKLRSDSSSSSSSSSTTASDSDDSTAAAPQAAEGVSSLARSGTGTATTAGGGKVTATATPAPGTSFATGAGSSSSSGASSNASSGEPADDSASPSSPAASSSRSSGSGSGSAAGGAPDGITGITLTGAFADTASYTIATGTWADVPGESSTVALDGFTSTANAAKATQGVIDVGDSTWYMDTLGMGLVMGSPGPSTHCWECVALQSTKDPSKSITAIVADSCEACEFAHIDLEQKAYFALGGTVDSGTVKVAWEFIDCPDG
ncbi:hypothetical protein JCM1841_006278 [Sporobolomyces salmonicolor]